MAKIKHCYSSLSEIINLKLSKFVNEKYNVCIEEKRKFNPNFQWIEVTEKSNFTIASYESSSCIDTQFKLFYYLYNLGASFNLSLDLSESLKSYYSMFTVTIFKENITKEILFKFYLGLNKKDFKKLSIKNNFSIFKPKPKEVSEKIKMFANISSLVPTLNQVLELSYNNVFLVKGIKVFKLKEFNVSEGLLILKLGEKMEDKIKLGLELQSIEVGFMDFNKLNVGSEIEMHREDIKEIISKVGESSFALAEVNFNENGLSLKVKDLI